MDSILQLILNNKDIVSAVVAIIAIVGVLGRKMTMNIVIRFLHEAKDEAVVMASQHSSDYANYIYSKLPRKAKLFVTPKAIEKIIIRIIDEIKSLDKK